MKYYPTIDFRLPIQKKGTKSNPLKIKDWKAFLRLKKRSIMMNRLRKRAQDKLGMKLTISHTNFNNHN